MNPIQDYSAIVQNLSGLESHLLSKIKGQNHVIPRVCSVLERGQLGLQPIGKPLGSFLFLGPTGVGKTELTLEFNRYLFGGDPIFRFDMSEFLHLDNVKLFMGDETGSPGRLGNVLSQHYQGVLLFDEIEKAHHLIWDLFLQMLDTARITLADHRAYDLSGFYIVCTSNIGSQQLLRPTRLPPRPWNGPSSPSFTSSSVRNSSDALTRRLFSNRFHRTRNGKSLISPFPKNSRGSENEVLISRSPERHLSSLSGMAFTRPSAHAR
jgi:ATP-dependent Clp protease ATP-binding subunit ClpA